MKKSGRDGRPATSVRLRRPESAEQSYASTPGVRSRMQTQRTRDTGPEMAVRRLLHAQGFRYRVDWPPLSGLHRRADLVFGPAKVAVYIDGCFWHGCPEHGRPRTEANPEYWSSKIERNRSRDAETDRLLSEAGWIVVRVWEHDAPELAVELISSVLRNRRRAGP
jgi:DNA mismatch endonuclease (patch repair protein)